MALTHLAPWVPDDARPFDRRMAAHLLRRAGFGASPAEIEQAVANGLEATVEGLFEENSEQEAQFQQMLDQAAGSLFDLGDPGQAQTWWVHRMVRTHRPLQEKITLFWHGHFATSFHKVEDGHLMHQQIETLRRLGLGNFRELVAAVARDPAMLVWLDGESSTKEHPNENFARELMELFTCGIGNYTERDVLEGARAFTGWSREGYQFVFHGDAHDAGRKQFLGRSGRFGGGEIIDILMQQPATSRFIAARLLRFFAAAEPAEEIIEEAAAHLDRVQLDIKWFLRDLLQSQYFFSDDCYRQRIASPAEFAVGTVRSLGARMPASEIRDFMNQMGQELLAPPNVKGWDGEQRWINSATWPARVAFANHIASLNSEHAQGRHLPLEQLIPADLNVPELVVDRLADLALQGDLQDTARAGMRELLVTTPEGPQHDAYRDDPGFRFDKNRQALALLLALPESHAY